MILNTIEDSDWYRAGKFNVEDYGLTPRPPDIEKITTIKGIPTSDLKLYHLVHLFNKNQFKIDAFFRLRDAILFHPEFIMRTNLGNEKKLISEMMQIMGTGSSELYELNKEFAIFLQERLVDHH